MAQRRHCRDDIERGAHGPLRVIFMRLRIPEIGEHAVTHELRDKTVVAGDAVGDLLLVGTDQ